MTKTSANRLRQDLTLPWDDDPMGRLAALGPGPLALWELLELVFGGRGPRAPARRRAVELATTFSSVSVLAGATFDDLAAVVGSRRAGALVAALELGHRVQTSPAGTRPVVRTAADVHRLLGWDMRHLDREHFRAVLLNTRNQVIRVSTVSIGGLSQAPVHPREVFKDAIKHGACGVIIVHNHPSGDATPSHEDRMITDQLAVVGKLIGIPLLDHVIIGDGQYVSLGEQGLLTPKS